MVKKKAEVKCEKCFHYDVCEFADDYANKRNCGHYADGGKSVLANKLEHETRKNETLLKMVNGEREKVKGYEEIAKVHSAYIAILLQKLGATKDNTITITAPEVTEAMHKYEARAMFEPTDNSWKIYCEVIE